jgi:hypothetical protein
MIFNSEIQASAYKGKGCHKSSSGAKSKEDNVGVLDTGVS